MPTIEHEVKVLEMNDKVVMKQLENMGAKYMNTVSIRDWYYDTKDGALAQEHIRLRIRRQDDEIIVTKKTKYEHRYTKSMREDDVYVDDFEQAKKILEDDLWLIEVKYKEKTRVSYQLDNLIFDFDYYEWIPPVLEIEGETPKHVYNTIRRLWLQFHVQVKWGSKRLFKHYGKKIT